MARQDINKGNYPNDPNADTVPEAFKKINEMLGNDIYPVIDGVGEGIKPFATKADMDAFTPGADDPKVAIVMNDSTASNNGWYRWDSGSSSWVKRDEFYATTLDPADTSEAVTGKAVGDFTKTINTHDYIIEDRAIQVVDREVIIGGGTRIYGAEVKDGDSTYTDLPTGTYSVDDFSILAYKIDTNEFTQFAWFPSNSPHPAWNTVADDKNYIPIAYYGKAGDIELVTGQRNYESAYITPTFYKVGDSVRWNKTFVFGKDRRPNSVIWHDISADSDGITIGETNALLLDILTGEIKQATAIGGSPQNGASFRFQNDSRYRVIAYHRSGTQHDVVLNPQYAINRENKSSYETEDYVRGLSVSIINGSTVEVSEGYVNGNYIPTTQLTRSSLGADESQSTVRDLTTDWWYIENQNNVDYRAMRPRNIVVKDSSGTVLTEDTDWEKTSEGEDVEFVKIRSLSGIITDAQISYDLPMGRIDQVLVNPDTGELYLNEGVEKNYNWAFDYEIPDNRVRIANLFKRWDRNFVSTDIFDECRFYNNYGLSKDEEGTEVYSGTDMERMVTNLRHAIVTKYEYDEPIRIAVLGDSVMVGQQEHNLDDTDTAWGIIQQFAKLVHQEYPDAEVILYSTGNDGDRNQFRQPSWSAQNGSKMKIHIYNYSKSGHTLYEFIHDGDQHYDKQESGKYSYLYDETNRAFHDLVIFGRTNNSMTGDLASTQSVRDIMTASPYNLSLKSTPYNTDYEKYSDNAKIYRALVERVINDTMDNTDNEILGKPSVIFLSQTPPRIDEEAGRFPSFTRYGQWNQGIIHSNIANENNLPFIDIYSVFRTMKKRIGFDYTMATAAQDRVHPTAYIAECCAHRMKPIIPENIVKSP